MNGISFWRFAVRRLVLAVVLLIGVTLVVFTLTTVVPGDPVSAALGEAAANDPDAVRAYEKRHGLDQPLPIQYTTYVINLLHGELGISRLSGRPIRDDLADYVPASIELALIAVVIAFVVGVSLGTAAAMFRDRALDHVVRVVTLAGVSMPIFWLALVAFYVLSFKLRIFPGIGRLDPEIIPPAHKTGMYTVDAVVVGDWRAFRSALWHAMLPSLVLAAYAVSLLTRFTRSAVLDALSNDFVRTARSKGLPEFVVARHVLRAAFVPIVTVAGVMFGILLSGTVFIESIFSWPGLGQYAFRSATSLDLPAIMGVSLFVALVYIGINFGVDLLYGVIDPRIRLR